MVLGISKLTLCLQELIGQSWQRILEIVTWCYGRKIQYKDLISSQSSETQRNHDSFFVFAFTRNFLCLRITLLDGGFRIALDWTIVNVLQLHITAMVLAELLIYHQRMFAEMYLILIYLLKLVPFGGFYFTVYTNRRKATEYHYWISNANGWVTTRRC